MPNKSWPANNDTTSFRDLTKPIIDAITFAYQMKRQNEDTDIPWDGLDIGDDLKATCFSPDEQLTAEQLHYSDEHQGRSALEEIVSVAVQLGMEQGKRHFLTQRMRFWTLHLRMAVDTAVAKCLKEQTAEFLDEAQPEETK